MLAPCPIMGKQMKQSWFGGTLTCGAVAAHSSSMRLDPGEDVGFVELEVAPGSKAAGSALAQLHIPHGSIVVSIRRGDQVLVPKGDTVIESGDQVTAFLEQTDRKDLDNIFRISAVGKRPPAP